MIQKKSFLMALLFTIVGFGAHKLLMSFSNDRDVIETAFNWNERHADLRRPLQQEVVEHIYKLDSVINISKENVSSDSLLQLLTTSRILFIKTGQLLYNDEEVYHFDSIMFSKIFPDDGRRVQ